MFEEIKPNKKVINEVKRQIKKHPRYLSTLQKIITEKKLFPRNARNIEKSVFNQIMFYNRDNFPDGGGDIDLISHRHDIVGDDGETYYDQPDFLVTTR